MSNQKNPEPTRHLPVRPNLDQLKHQAKDLLRSIRSSDPTTQIKLADAQLILARDPTLTSERGEALRHLLYLFERDEAIRLLRAG